MIREMTIGSIMTPKPVCIEAGMKLDRAKAQMETHKVRQLPVTRFGRLAGVLTSQSVKFARSNPFREGLAVEDVMDVAPYIVPPDLSAEDVLLDMLHYKLEYVLVARDENRPIGIFTRQDALRMLLNPLRTRRKAALRLIKSDSSNAHESAHLTGVA